jgi:hypothetical protein
VVVFQTGSLYKFTGAGITPSFAGRTYADVEFAGSGTSSSTGSLAVVMDNLKVTSGTVNVNLTGTSGHSIKGDISVATGATLTFSPASAATMNLNGTSGQTISGAGTLTISSNQTISVSNSAGVTVNKTLTNSGALNVSSGGTIKGTGTILGPVSVASGGTVAPGSSPGILNTGDVSFATGSAYAVEIGGTTVGTDYDQQNVTGTVALSNATLTLTQINSFTPIAGNAFTIINNDSNDAVGGTFNGLAEGATISNFLGSGLNGIISYSSGSGNDVVITVQAPPGTTDVSLYSGNLVIGDVNGDDTDDTLTISLNGSNVRITDPNHTLNCGAGATTINANTCEVPFASISGNLQVNTLGGNDSLTVDLAGGDCIPNGGLSYDGGAQTTGDKLSITGGSQGTVTYNYTAANDGTIEMQNFGTVTYTGLEPITNTGTPTDVIFNLPAGGNVATLSGLGGGNSRLASTGTFEQTDFANPSGSVTINGGANNDSISVGALDVNYPNLTINGNQGTDTVGFTGNTTFAAAASLDVNLQDDDPTPGIDNVFVNGQLIVSGAGKIDIRASEDVTVNNGGKLQVENGDLTIEANQQDPSTATDHNGVDVNGGTIQTIGTGNISIKGRGGEGAFDTMYGVIVWNGGKILSTGSGTISVDGSGGNRTGGAAVGSELYGVYVYLLNSEISSTSAAITIKGTGGATNDTGSYGVTVEGGKIQQGGAGTLTIDGTGGTCTGGNAGFANSIGVAVFPDDAATPAGGIVTSTGAGVNAGNISITGIAGDGGNGGAQGVRVDGPGMVTSVDGSITFVGTGAACGNACLGTSIRGAVTASGAGAISITGTGADSTGAFPTHGVNVRSGAVVSAKDGNITVTGTGGNGANNAGFDSNHDHRLSDYQRGRKCCFHSS